MPAHRWKKSYTFLLFHFAKMHFRRFIWFNKQFPMYFFFFSEDASVKKRDRNGFGSNCNGKCFNFSCRMLSRQNDFLLPIKPVRGYTLCKCGVKHLLYSLENRALDKYKERYEKKARAHTHSLTPMQTSLRFVSIAHVSYIWLKASILSTLLRKSARACHCYRKIIMISL